MSFYVPTPADYSSSFHGTDRLRADSVATVQFSQNHILLVLITLLLFFRYLGAFVPRTVKTSLQEVGMAAGSLTHATGLACEVQTKAGQDFGDSICTG